VAKKPTLQRTAPFFTQWIRA